MSSTLTITAKNLAQKTRLDRAIRNHYPNWGRRAVQALVTAGKVKVNGQKVWLCSWQVANGDQLEIANPPQEKVPPPTLFDESWLIAEDEQIIAINKPAGLLSHATRWTSAGNLLDLVTARFGAVTLFHRLDRDTSGVMIFTREGSSDVNRYLDAAFKARTVQKEYLAVVPSPNGLAQTDTIENRLGQHPSRRDMMSVVERGGKRAVTRYELGEEKNGLQLVHLWPQTGRTHQLRVHMAHLRAPILGDRLYGNKSLDQQHGIERLMLHAHKITLPAADSFVERVFVAAVGFRTADWEVGADE